ncbi:MAG: bifunctional folylpolyglutamate synthase/dihydrofolate synthase [Roseiflexaceae bacterium]
MQSPTYQEALDYLYSFLDTERTLPRRPAELNLPRTSALLAALGEPQRSLRSVVIAGTKGKGSTAAMIEAITRAAGLRTGLWTSPHLHSYRERIQVDRALITQAELVAEVAAIQPVVAAFNQDRYGAPSVFELGFAIALRYFAKRQVDLAILEVGLGGRYDSANAVTPLLSIITSISYDHMQILGDTLHQIAYEKAGILKPGVSAITIAQPPEAMDEIARVAAVVGAPLWVAADLSVFRGPWSGATDHGPRTTDGPTWFDPFERYRGPAETALRGMFQRENARLAAGAALLLRDQGLPISDDAIGAGLAAAQWAGRLELIPGDPPIVLDGAHNGDSAHKLVQSLGAAFPGRRLVLVLGTSQDKDITRILAELAPAAGALVLTRSQHPRAWVDLEELAARAEPLLHDARIPIVIAPDVPKAIERARKLAGPGDLICVTGSLFVVAAAREALGLAAEKD